ncbi:AAA family ATPase [Pontivivens ytuae]|uniref:AAA family ATPase n=1 Tax=Pontivivens ytuae TaxID=2789856 RepID=A0A7S9LRT3_9RHOB|nr:ATP-binding protein [Pontivivens ytuae]QPH54042.1 AAA family ATPase [Pontivivens ytuae]
MADGGPTVDFEERVVDRITKHFAGLRTRDLTTMGRVFPTTARPDLETAIADLLEAEATDVDFVGVSALNYRPLKFSALISERREPPIVVPAEYQDIDIGDETPGRCIVSGIWFFTHRDAPVALLVSQAERPYDDPGVRVEVVMSEAGGGRDAAQRLLGIMAKSLTERSVYAGRTLSFTTQRSYMGGLGALQVHQLPTVSLEDVILPRPTLEALQRTVFRFVETRAALKEHGFSTKRGLLLYGPPGTGKTHFIRYLLFQMAGHTALLVTAEQVAYFNQVMMVARALQPAIVVIEDADLLARAREERDGDCSQVLLNSLLNHMDGLTEDAEILFILTTNRPETLEAAVRDRPGRIDQAIEIPLPDAECRARLLRLYSERMTLPESIVEACVRRTDSVSAAFIRELARRMAQFALLRDTKEVGDEDMQLALDEMLNAGDFNSMALGAAS